jgi:glycosyltransferase involved in cell wall biosynthesis
MKSKVNIIMSTYNGDRYLRKQLDSLVAQTYDNCSIYVRDDGSKDSTIDILQQYADNNKIHLVKGENIGFCASFISLLHDTDDADYWSFCDQDDIWFPDKVARAVNWINTQNQVLPLLYHSSFEMVDQDENRLGEYSPPKNALCFQRALTGTFGVGFSMVINSKLRDMMLLCDPNNVKAHDWLAEIIALAFGKVYLDDRIMAKYRRLDSSVSKQTLTKRVKWALRTLFSSSEVQIRNREFAKVFFNILSADQIKLIALFVNSQYNLANNIKKALYPKRWRPNISSELAMRLLMIIGRI